jgi:hypothetical protein
VTFMHAHLRLVFKGMAARQSPPPLIPGRTAGQPA